MRRVAVGLEGSVKGPKFSGTVAPGALDFELTLGNGAIEIEQALVLQAADGSYIYVRTAGTGPNAGDVRVVMDFEAPNASEHAWLNSGKFVARRELNAAARSMRLASTTCRESPSAPATTHLDRQAGRCCAATVGVPQQASERATRRDTDHRERHARPVPESRREQARHRNIIPITGGTVSGRITGKVLMGGADYQILTPPATIDAHYLWQTDDGETIIVRNGGSFGGLVPTFETRVDGPYAYLNTGSYLSSNPGMGQGGVALVFYESANAR